MKDSLAEVVLSICPHCVKPVTLLHDDIVLDSIATYHGLCYRSMVHCSEERELRHPLEQVSWHEYFPEVVS